jgi:hypothetical protein
MRNRVHLLVVMGVFMLLGLAAVACNDEESAVSPSPAETNATEAIDVTPADAETEAEAEADEEEEADAEEPPFEVKRGCPACHSLIEPDTGKYTLGFEAHERAEARGKTHPDVALDGTAMGLTDEPNVATCLTCHAPGTGEREGKGKAASLSLRDITHPSHLFSEHFLDERGNCMSCHNVSGAGVWQLLSETVEVNEKGLPSPDQLPIPGLLDPSETQQ